MEPLQFRETFQLETRSERRELRLISIGIILLGIAIPTLILTDTIKWSGSLIFHLTGFSLILLFGIISFYWIGIRYEIYEQKHDSDLRNLTSELKTVKKKFKMDILKEEDGVFQLFFKPKFYTPWIEAYVLLTPSAIYVNARPITKGVVDFGIGRRWSKKLATELNKRR